MKNLFIYLSGSIKKVKNSEADETKADPSLEYWTELHIKLMKKLFARKGMNAVFLNPASRSDDLSDEMSIFGRDLLQVYLSDAVLADMRGKRGIGIGYETAFANFKGIPVISWVLDGGHYRPRELDLMGQRLVNWIHPFVSQPSAAVVGTLKEAVEFIATMEFGTKGILTRSDYVIRAIFHYLTSQFKQDIEMNELIGAYGELSSQVGVIINACCNGQHIYQTRQSP